MSQPSLTAASEPLDSGVRVRLSGELDIATAGRAEEELRRAEAGEPAVLAVDLGGLTFMDSTGLRLIVAAHSRARDADRSTTRRMARPSSWHRRGVGWLGP